MDELFGGDYETLQGIALHAREQGHSGCQGAQSRLEPEDS